ASDSTVYCVVHDRVEFPVEVLVRDVDTDRLRQLPLLVGRQPLPVHCTLRLAQRALLTEPTDPTALTVDLVQLRIGDRVRQLVDLPPVRGVVLVAEVGSR